MAKEKKLTFEQAIAKLEQIVSRIEQGEVPLEESIDMYAQGMRLIRQCRGILEGAEKKIRLLSEDQSQGLKAGGGLEDLSADSFDRSAGPGDKDEKDE